MWVRSPRILDCWAWPHVGWWQIYPGKSGKTPHHEPRRGLQNLPTRPQGGYLPIAGRGHLGMRRAEMICAFTIEIITCGLGRAQSFIGVFRLRLYPFLF